MQPSRPLLGILRKARAGVILKYLGGSQERQANMSPIILSNFILVVAVLPHPDDFSALIPFKYHFFAEGFIPA